MNSSIDPGLMAGVGIFYVAMIAFFIYCQWRVWSKAGFNGAWSLLLLVPICSAA